MLFAVSPGHSSELNYCNFKMLLNKYESFTVIAKDAYAEELLFKIEKNFTNFATLQDNAFPHL